MNNSRERRGKELKSQHMECASQAMPQYRHRRTFPEALQRVAAKVAQDSTPCDDGKVLDRNGNTVGFWTMNLLETDDDSEGC